MTDFKHFMSYIYQKQLTSGCMNATQSVYIETASSLMATLWFENILRVAARTFGKISLFNFTLSIFYN